MSIASQLPPAAASKATGANSLSLIVTTTTANETLTWSCSAGSIGTPSVSSDGKTVTVAWTAPSSDAVASVSCSSASGGSASWTIDCRSTWPSVGPPTLSGPSSGPSGAQAGPFTFSYAFPWYVGMPALVITPSSNAAGDTFQAASGGSSVASVGMAGGTSSAQFWLTPSTPGPRRICAQCSNPFDPSLPGTYIDFTAG